MLNMLLGRALMRWLERLADSHRDADPPPAPTPAFSPVEPPPAQAREIVYPKVSRAAMGSLFEVYLAGRDRDALIAAGEQALDEIERLDRQLSHYRDDSDITRLNQHAHDHWVRVEPRLYQMLKRCADLCEQTGGAFDIATGALVKAWGFHQGGHRVPSPQEIARLMESTGTYRILFDDEDHLVHFTAPELEVTLGAFGKGCAIDEAAERLRFYGVESAVIHGGQSTIYALGAPPGEDAWTFAIKDPRDKTTVIQEAALRDEALSTSGSYEQFFEVDGERFSHILDPRTGRPVQGMLSVSVVAPSAADSDALSTALFVMGSEAAQEFCRQRPEVRAIMMEHRSGGEIAITRIGFEHPE